MSEGTIRERVVGTFVIAAYAVRRTFVFSGRSRRTEFLCYLFVATMANILVLTAEPMLGSEQGGGTDLVIKTLLTLPLFALIARRFHDMGFTGWLALPTLVTVVMNLHKDAWFEFASLGAKPEGYPYDGPIQALALPGVIIMFWALIQQGQIGESNRYGPDPRLKPIKAEGDPAAA